MSRLYYINSEIALLSYKWLITEGRADNNSLILYGDSIRHLVPRDSPQFLSLDLFEELDIKQQGLTKLIVLTPAGNINETFKDFRRLESVGFPIEVAPQIDQWSGDALTEVRTSLFDTARIIKYPNYKIKNTTLFDAYKNKTALITGSGGSIGSQLLKHMVELGFKTLILLDNSEYHLYKLKEETTCHTDIELHFVLGDIRNENKIKQLFDFYSIDIVFHLAAYKHVHLMNENPDEAFEVNVLGTKIIFDLAIANKCDKFIFISTDKAVEPTTIMGCTKKIASDYVLSNSIESRTQVSVVRFGNILQSNGSVVDKFYHQIRSKEKVTVTNVTMERFFMLIEDVSKFILDVGHMSFNRKHLVFDIKEQTKLVDLIDALSILSGLPDKTKPSIEQKQMITAGEKLYETLYSTEENLEPTENCQIKLINPTTVDSKILNKEISRLARIVKTKNRDLKLNDLKQVVNLSKKTEVL